MTNVCQPGKDMRVRLVTRKTFADGARIVLIILNCIYGFHVISGFVNTQSHRSTTAGVVSKLQPGPFVPVAGQWDFEIDSSQSRSRLLPLPENARTVCNRSGDQGIVQMEIINVSTTQQELLECWRSAGWDVRASPHQRPGGIAYFCTRRDEFVYAWSADKQGRIESLMLVNVAAQDANEITLPLRNAQ